ncbi:MAG: hypothetical protein O3A37_00615 [Planctomycetota bacterium]|nr:hypothetical protein [Planctomycetota bacterium]
MAFGFWRDSLIVMHRDAVIHRFIAWLSLVGYALVASGLPLPLGAVAPGSASPAAEKRLAVKDRSAPFPCMDKPCGCVTAEQCFTNCCCNTPAETLAWAQAHQVDPAVIVALQRRAAAPAEKTTVASSCCSVKKQTSCCSTPSVPACCDEAESVAGSVSLAGMDICSDYESLAAMSDERQETEAAVALAADSAAVEPVSLHTVVLKSMLACGGIVSQWRSVGGAPPPPVVLAVVSVTPLAEAILPGDDAFSSDRAAPDAPPPRVA